ncbi:MAG: VWA domain-containing protein [Marinibacterium sp.]|nr:VWA domain-containing protein [Marinibacterium sp.]
MRHTLISALALLASSLPLGAADSCARDAMLVFDGSGSMAEMGFNQIGEPRIFDARRAVVRALPEIAAKRRVGLVIYGPGGVDSCTGIDLRFGPIDDAATPIIDAVDHLQPAGDTALTDAVRQAAETLEYRDRPGIIVLLTDGKETCGGSPCALAGELLQDARDLTVHVIGFKVRGDFFAWDGEGPSDYDDAITVASCLADRTGGLYVPTETVDDLVAALRKTLGCLVIG